jgi:hypothetical protein
VQGLLGRGLGLIGTKECPLSGSYTAYAAGTGVLVFIDLVAAIARHKMTAEAGLEIKENFKFTLHVQFRDCNS